MRSVDAPSPQNTQTSTSPSPSPTPNQTGATSGTNGWLLILVAVIALSGVLITALVQWLIGRRTSKASRREEAMRNVRWAAEHAASGDENRLRLGLATLQALKDADIADKDVEVLMLAALSAVVTKVEERASGAALELTATLEASGVVGAGSAPDVPSEPDEEADDGS